MDKTDRNLKKEIYQQNITDSKINLLCLQKSFSRVLQQKPSTNYRTTQLESFQRSMKYFILLGQYICMFPIFRKNQLKKYSFFSWRYIPTLVACVSQLVAAILCFDAMIKTSVNIGKFGRVIFYSKSCICSILTIRLAAKWHYLMKQIAAADLDEYIDPSIQFKCNLATIVFLGLALVNYFLSRISKFATILDCTHNNSILYEQYILNSYNWFFGMGVPFSLLSGILLHILTMVSSLSLTYCQVFVICVSLYLSSILQQLNKKISTLEFKYVASSYWRALRQDYNRVTRLIHTFDDVINNIVLASFAGSLYDVCLQVFYVLRNDITVNHGTELCDHNDNRGLLHGYDHVITNIYFIYSTILVIIRSLSVSIIATKVHSTSLEIVPILYSVPAPTYCIEIQRFIDQIHGNTVALTGQNYFCVTKELILSMIGTIVTYELVLLQLK